MSLDPNLKVQVDKDNKRIDIRQSAVSTFVKCRRQFFYEYVLGVEPDYPERARPWATSDTGTAFHEGIGAYYTGGDPHVAVERWFEAQWPGELPEKDELELVRIMLDGHIGDVESDGADVHETAVAVEVPVTATVHDVDRWDVTIHGRVDRLVEDSDGNRIIDDWKSVATFAPIDSYMHQLGRYALLVRSETGWAANRVRTTQVKRVKRTKGGPFYTRPWTPVSEEAYRTHASGLRATLVDLVRCLDQDGTWYENYTTECRWRCRVQDLCQAQMRGDDPEMILDIHYREKQ
tara:strand:+ start:189 stop:1061 length:873 start_codon:yes stop_codon:yes gene_type:complete